MIKVQSGHEIEVAEDILRSWHSEGWSIRGTNGSMPAADAYDAIKRKRWPPQRRLMRSLVVAAKVEDAARAVAWGLGLVAHELGTKPQPMAHVTASTSAARELLAHWIQQGMEPRSNANSSLHRWKSDKGANELEVPSMFETWHRAVVRSRNGVPKAHHCNVTQRGTQSAGLQQNVFKQKGNILQGNSI